VNHQEAPGGCVLACNSPVGHLRLSGKPRTTLASWSPMCSVALHPKDWVGCEDRIVIWKPPSRAEGWAVGSRDGGGRSGGGN
jgi:hypothetical protein